MRESTSPPREEASPNGSTSSNQSVEAEVVPTNNGKKYANGNNLSPNNNGNGKQVNNNESMTNSNLSNGSGYTPKQTRNSATSPTCRASSRNGKLVCLKNLNNVFNFVIQHKIFIVL